jgi:predicted transcriptional regulator
LVVSVEPDTRKMVEESRQAALRAFETGEYQGEFRVFSSAAQLFDVFTPRRWEFVAMLQSTGPSSLRGLARALGRDVKRVHEDAAALLDERVIEKNEQGKLFVPFASIRIAADLVGKAAA